MSNIESYKIESQAEADAYLKDFFSHQEHRTMDEVVVRADRYIPSDQIRSYFLSQAEKWLSSRDAQL